MSDHSELIRELRENAKGRYFWRCQHKTEKYYRIEFEEYEQHEAKQWFKEQCERFPDSYRGYEMVRVHVLYQQEKLMLQAADALERTSPKSEMKRTVIGLALVKYYIFRRDLWVKRLAKKNIFGNELLDHPKVAYWQSKISNLN